MSKKLKIKDLIPDAENFNKGNEFGESLIEKSFERFGAGRSILIDKNNKIIAGNKSTQKFVEQGGADVIIVETTGKELVAVKRNDIDLNTKRGREMALADNATAKANITWDAELLTEWEMPLNDWGVELPDFETVDDEPKDAEPQIDKAEELNKVWQVQKGDLWQIGEHRLLCGDSTVKDDVARVLGEAKPNLMVTDPPYGVEYDPEWREGADLGVGERSKGKVENDDRNDWTEAWLLSPAHVAYVWHAGVFAGEVAVSLASAKFLIRAQIVWVKQHFVLSRGAYHWQHEPCWYAVKKGKTSSWTGDRTQSTSWEIANNNSFGNSNKEETFGHSTQKPLECMARPIRNHEGDVYEPFAGSGTTLVACENLNRKCYAIEISPAYCACILERMKQAFPDIEIKRING